jgi:uridine kinase
MRVVIDAGVVVFSIEEYHLLIEPDLNQTLGGFLLIIVGICGASGSGKSTLAKRIADSLACTCTIIGQDCYYRNFPDLPFEKRIKLNYDEPEIFDFEEMFRDVEKLLHGEPITTKGYDYTNYLRADSPDVFIQPPEVLILEGIHMFYDKRICDLMSLKVYLHVDVDVCLLRRIKRDIKVRGRNIDNIAEQYMETVKPVYEKYIEGYINDADFAVMRGGKNKMAIDAISAYLTTKVLVERFGTEAPATAIKDKPVAGEPDELPDSPQTHAEEKKTGNADAEIEGDDPFDFLVSENRDFSAGDGEVDDSSECEEYEDEDGTGYIPSRRFRHRRRVAGKTLRFLFFSALLNFGLAIFALFMFGQVYNHDWAMTQSGGLNAIIDAGVQMFFLVLPLLLAVLFNRLLYKMFDLEYSPGWLVFLLILWVIIVLSGTVYLVYAFNLLDGMAAFGLGGLFGA